MKELARSLRLKPVYAMGHLHALWHDALEQQEDGDLSSWSDELIAESSQFDGDAPRYVSLLQYHRWLDGRLIHDWLSYAGRYLEGKYHTSNPVRLSEIWGKYGLVYLKADRRLPKGDPPNQTLPNLPKETSPPPPFGEFMQSWNQNRGLLPEAKTLNRSRKAKIAARWAEVPDLAYWSQVASRLAASSFATQGNWASFDWVLANDRNHVKVMEGNYDDKRAIPEVIR